jgi:cytidylate kinase
MPVVTISRQFGAGGSSVAAIVAEELHADVVDKKLVDEIAARLQLKPDDVEAESEHPRRLFDRIIRSFSSLEPGMGAAWTPPYPEDPFFDPRVEIIRLTEQTIKEAAASGNVVIVGRAAAFVLRDRPEVFRVFLRAPEASRVKTLEERFGLDEATARRKMHETDANRAAYTKQLYGRDWTDPDEYDLIVNTGRIDYATAAHIILHGVEGRSKSPASVN